MKKFSFLAVLLVAFIVVGCTGNADNVDFAALENDLTNDVTQYYNDNLKDMVIGVNEHKVTLEQLEAGGVDIDKYIEADCDIESYSLVKLTLDEENNVTGEPVVENNLSCAGYTPDAE